MATRLMKMRASSSTMALGIAAFSTIFLITVYEPIWQRILKFAQRMLTRADEESVSGSHKVTAVESASPKSSCAKDPQTFALFKPDGYLSQFVNNGKLKRRQKMLGELTAAHPDPCGGQLDGLMPIGRLDEQSEGLLLLTTDGFLSFAITNSKGRIEKEYLVQLDGHLSDDALQALREGVRITKKVGSGGFINQDASIENSAGFKKIENDDEDSDDRVAVGGSARCSSHFSVPVAVERLAEPPDLPARRWPIKHRGATSWCRITLTEGKYRQVRRMTAAVGHPTLRLVRTRVGPVELGSLRPGQLRALGRDEVSAIWAQTRIYDLGFPPLPEDIL